MANKNKVFFGLKNLHFAVATETEGTITYGAPVKWEGAVNLAHTPSGERSDFYADDVDYYAKDSNNGYELALEVAKVIDEYYTQVLGNTLGADGEIIESADNESKMIAIGFEIDGDKKGRRCWYYYCSPSRPTVTNNTKTSTTDPVTASLSLVARPRPTDMKVRKMMEYTAEKATEYSAFFTKVE